MVRSLWSGVSGLNAHQTRMDVIGNNIANVNTYGFKASRTSFSDIYYQAKKSATGGTTTFAGNNQSAVGYGVEVSSIDKDMSTSSFQNTNRTLDVSITGNGFFMTATVDDMLNVDDVNYTRYGSFGVDSAGNLVNTLNRFVLGTNNNGTYTDKEMDEKTPAQNPMDLETINVNDRVWEAFRRYTEIDYTDVPKIYKGTSTIDNTATPPTTNIANRAIFEGTDPYDATKKVAYDRDYNSINGAGDNTTADAANVFASEKLLKDAIEEDLRAVAGGGTGPNGVLGNTNIILKSDYVLYYVGGKYVNNQGVEYDPEVGAYKDEDGSYYNYQVITSVDDDGNITKEHTYTRLLNGADGKPVTTAPTGATAITDGGHGFNGKATGTSKTDATTGVTTTTLTTQPFVIDTAQNSTFTYNETTKSFETQDVFGNTIFANMSMRPLSYGDLSGLNVNSKGDLVASYAGEIKTIARIELATFDNPEGLDQIGETAFAESTNSGEPRVKSPGKMGAGNTQESKLEMSNVNLANEFSDMIVTQRGFQANARIITTSDSMLEELVNMKR